MTHRLSATAAIVLLAAMAGCGSHGGSRSSSTPATAAVSSGPGPSAAVTPSTAGLPRPDHVVVAIFENKSFPQVASGTAAPYLSSLMTRSAVFTDAHGIAHPSQPNYLALFSGSTHGVTDDHCPVRLTGQPNLARQLLDAHLSFVGYAEDLPATDYRGCSQGRYAAKHNPWADFDNVPPAANQPLTAFPADYTQLPTVSFVVPNICDDMHDCGVGTGDAWARTHLDGYLSWADTHNSLLVITFDEDDNTTANRILTLAAGPMVRPATYSEPIDHYRLLHTIEGMYGLPPLGVAVPASPLTDIWR